jgi:UDP-N-acetyl-2-amino-2-deoxyglucuronate dehydrogenase
MKNFGLIGASGYIAPRHMKAIKETNNKLVAALDPYDGIGIMDSHFPEASFFTEFERFDRYVDKCRRNMQNRIEYMAIATPNYLHDAHIRFALRSGADAICEKPLVLNPHNLNQLKIIEQETGKRVYTILQLRLHPSIIALRKKILNELKQDPKKVYDIELTYLTSRGKWYFISWKGDNNKSGGIASNIGVHFFDMLSWIFGEVQENTVHLKTSDTNAGTLRFKNARVNWFLSVNSKYLPQSVKDQRQATYRSITINDDEIEFSDGFKDLHTRSYKEMLNGNGFGLDEAFQSVSIVSQIRKMEPIGLLDDYHPLCEKVNYV